MKLTNKKKKLITVNRRLVGLNSNSCLNSQRKLPNLGKLLLSMAARRMAIRRWQLAKKRKRLTVGGLA